MIAAAGYNVKGIELWNKEPNAGCEAVSSDIASWPSIIPAPNFERYMSSNRFKQWRKYIPCMCADPTKQHDGKQDDWWQFSNAIEEFNEHRRDVVLHSLRLVEDESMAAWVPRTTKFGGLPNLSHINRKPEPLGTEFKDIGCAVLGVLLVLEIQRGKEGMKSMTYNSTIGATAGCTLRLAKEALPIVEGETPALIEGDAWFGSVRCAAALAQEGYKCVLQVKQNNGLFPKKFIKDALADAPGGVHIVLQGTYQNVPLIAIGYRYSTRTTLSFVATKSAGSTRPGTPYEMKFNDDFGNVVVREVDRPDMISEFFKHSNTIDKHNQSRQSELALEKRWLTHDPYFRLLTTLIGTADC